MRYYLTIGLLIITFSAWSQISGVYETHITDDSFVHLDLSKDFRYILELTIMPPPGSDIITSTLLSFGTYSLDRSSLYLTDYNQITSIKLNRNDDQFIFADGFKFLINRKFKLTYYIPDVNTYFDDRELYIGYVLLDEGPREVKFTPGRYYGNIGYRIFINENSKYEFFLNANLISSGTWVKKGGYLILTDSFFLKDAKIKILDTQTIICSIMPYMYGETGIFKLSKQSFIGKE